MIGTAHPNLALVKYWGKDDAQLNIPATPSIGINIDALVSTTRVSMSTPALREDASEKDSNEGMVSGNNGYLSWRLSIDGTPQHPQRFREFFHALLNEANARSILLDSHLEITSSNNFPTAAGLASSASGFAALALAVNGVLGLGLNASEMSSLARVGSGSASRSLFGGFVDFPRGSSCAGQIFPKSHWPDLRCIIIMVNEEKKELSSREAMERCRLRSPYYEAWLKHASLLYEHARDAIEARDIEKLGTTMRQSYLGMFSTMFSTDEPIILWQPTSLEIIKTVEDLRRKGIPVFETMDAGPQVKLITTLEHCERIRDELRAVNPKIQCLVSETGAEPELCNE